MFWRLSFTMAGKDWRLFWADPRAALLCFAVPIALASAFGAIFDQAPKANESTRLPLAIVNESDDPAVAAFVNELAKSTRLEAKIASRAEAEAMLADRSPGVVVILPAAFNLPKNLSDRPRLEIVHHPLCGREAQWAEGAITESLMKRIAGAYGLTQEPPFIASTSTIAGPSFNSYSHSFNGMTLQYLLFWGMESGLLLLRERSNGVWRRVRSSPVPLSAVLIGKAIATAGIALLQVMATFAFGYFVFDVRIAGSFSGFVMMALGVSLLAAALGLTVAAVGGTEARARSLTIVMILGVSMLGGLWLPSFLLPAWVRDLSQALPTRWAMLGLDSVTWQGRGVEAVLPCLLAVLAFSLAFLLIAFQRFRAAETRSRKGFRAA